MADQRITELTAFTTLASGDLLAMVDDPAGSPATKKITCDNFFANVPAVPLGATATPFTALYLDNAATDGGAVYFNAGSTSFLKASADGLTLDIGGFTAITGANIGGLIPLGGYIAMGIGITGAASDANMLTAGFAKCDGTTPAAQGVSSPTITATMPDINAGAFIRGNTVAWTTGAASGGADTHTHTMANHTHTGPSHTHTGPSHTHTGPSHTHDVSGTTGAGSAHSHSSGSIIAHISPFYNDNYTYFALSGTFTSAWRGSEGGGFAASVESRDGVATSGTTGSESSHTHSFSDTSTAAGTGATSASGTGATSASGTDASGVPSTNTSDAGSTLPSYFSAVMYMRVR